MRTALIVGACGLLIAAAVVIYLVRSGELGIDRALSTIAE